MSTLTLSIILLVGIIIIKAIWLITDTTPLRKIEKVTLIKSNSIELAILILQAIAAVVFPLPPTRFDTAVMLFGIGLYVFGVIFAIWGRISLHTTWGHPGKQISDFQKKLITTRAFAVSRNPIYVGFLCLFFG